MQRALDFDKTPQLGVPLPFMLNVPLFMLLAGVLITWQADVIFSASLNAPTLALTHLWTLGILGSAMLGALLQILAVACNVPTPGSRLLAGWVHALLSVGTLVLVAGFLWWLPAFWISAIILLGAAFALYLVTVAYGLWLHRKQVYQGAREILIPVRFALIALTITVILGLTMAAGLGTSTAFPDWLHSHILWGLLGWGGLLLMGMSFQLIPIFQITEIYPKEITRWLPLIIPVLLLAWSALDASQGLPALMLEAAELLLLIGYSLWAVTTLNLLLVRKRKFIEATTLFWYTSMLSLLACAPGWLWLNYGNSRTAEMLLGVLIIVGVLGSVVNGMIYKIVPFLLWKHAQNAIVLPGDDFSQARAYLNVLPKMLAYIPEKRAKSQWTIHLIMLLACLLAALDLAGARAAAGPLMMASALALGFNLVKAIMLYRQALKAIAATRQKLELERQA